MYRPPIESDSALFFQMYSHLAGRLSRERAVKRLVAPLRVVSELLEKAEAHREATHQAVITALALRDAADDEADDLLRRFHERLEAVTGKANGGKVGRGFFPEGLHALITAPIAAQAGEMRVLARKLDGEEEGELRALAPMVHEAGDTLERYQKRYEGLVVQAEAAYGDVLRARTAWIRVYDKIYAELARIVGKREAEEYFLKRPGRRGRTRRG